MVDGGFSELKVEGDSWIGDTGVTEEVEKLVDIEVVGEVFD